MDGVRFPVPPSALDWSSAGKMTKPCLEEETRLCHLREVGIQRRIQIYRTDSRETIKAAGKRDGLLLLHRGYLRGGKTGAKRTLGSCWMSSRYLGIYVCVCVCTARVSTSATCSVRGLQRRRRRANNSVGELLSASAV